MGSFNVGCGISNLSIEYGEQAGFVVLDRAPSYADMKHGLRDAGATIITYANDIYRPVFPPVYGTYDDYGRIREIIPSVTTRLLEQIFHRPVEAVLDCIGSTRSVYDTMGEVAEHYLKPGHLLGEYKSTTTQKLQSIGFTKVEGLEDAYLFEGARLQISSRREEQLGDYTHIWEDWEIVGTDESVLATGLSGTQFDNVLSLFAQLTGFYPGFEREDWQAVQRLHDLSGMFFLPEAFHTVRDAINKDAFDKRYLVQFREDWDQFMGMFQQQEDGSPSVHPLLGLYGAAAQFIGRNMMLPSEEFELLHVYTGDYSFQEIMELFQVLTAVNRMFQPSMYAGQEGDGKAARALAKAQREILKARRAKWES